MSTESLRESPTESLLPSLSVSLLPSRSDRKLYYVLWLLIVLFLVNAWRDARSTGGIGFADLVVLVLWCVIAFAISFILRHLVLKSPSRSFSRRFCSSPRFAHRVCRKRRRKSFFPY